MSEFKSAADVIRAELKKDNGVGTDHMLRACRAVGFSCTAKYFYEVRAAFRRDRKLVVKAVVKPETITVTETLERPKVLKPKWKTRTFEMPMTRMGISQSERKVGTIEMGPLNLGEGIVSVLTKVRVLAGEVGGMAKLMQIVQMMGTTEGKNDGK